MNYYLFKLRFLSALHVGDSSSANSLDTAEYTIRADTLFSSLCHTALVLFGKDEIKLLYDAVQSNSLKISDSFPYKNNSLYIAKPNISKEVKSISIEMSKAMKRVTHIPVNLVIKFIKGDMKPEEADCNFGVITIVDKVNLRNPEKPEPFSVAQIFFNDGCGLYVIFGIDNDYLFKKIDTLMTHLGLSGIGGKVSAGYGKFSVSEIIELSNINKSDHQLELLRRMLLNANSQKYILISSSIPKDDELDCAIKEATYSLIRRGGYVQSESYSSRPVKKKTQYFFSSGSVFTNIYEGDIFNVAYGGSHSVYRYSKPIFLGVNI